MNSGRHECALHARRLPAALLALAACALAPTSAHAKISTPRSASTTSTFSTERSGSTPLTTFQPFNLSTSSYVWGLDIDGTLQGAGGVGGLLAVIRDDGVFLPCYDANGNITEYVTTNSEVVAHYDYSPFGEQLISSGPLASTFTHRFSTTPWCADTRLVEYQMRKYRPDIGKWMSRDMMLDFDYQIYIKLHEYLFCNNSTAIYFDFVGEYAVAIPVIIETSKIIGAALVVIGTHVTIKVIDAVEDWVSEGCANKPQHEPERFCLPCDPPVGSIAYRVDLPPSKAHNGIPTPHSHVYQVMQSPVEKGCKCFWSEIAKDPLPGVHTPYIVNPILGEGIGYR